MNDDDLGSGGAAQRVGQAGKAAGGGAGDDLSSGPVAPGCRYQTG